MCALKTRTIRSFYTLQLAGDFESLFKCDSPKTRPMSAQYSY